MTISYRNYSLICLYCLCFAAFALAQPDHRLEADPSRCQAKAILSGADRELKQGHASQARALAVNLRKCAAMSPAERFDLGLIYGRLHDCQGALALFQSVDKNTPNPQAHAYAIALGQFELAYYPAVIATLEDLMVHASLNVNSINLLAVCYSKAERYQDAYSLLMDHLQKDSTDPLGYLNLITLLTDVGQLEQAVKVASRAIEVFPDRAEMLVVRGAALTSLGELDKARRDFASAVALSPKESSPRFFLAVTDYQMDNYALAASELRVAVASGVVDADLEYLLAECMLKINPDTSHDAIKHLNQAITINRNSVPALTLRGKLLMQEGETRGAVVDLERAHRIDPKMRSATYDLARAYMALGRKAEADPLLGMIHQQSVDTVHELSDQRMR